MIKSVHKSQWQKENKFGSGEEKKWERQMNVQVEAWVLVTKASDTPGMVLFALILSTANLTVA